MDEDDFAFLVLQHRTSPENVVALYQTGWSVTRLSQHTGLHRSTIYRLLKREGAYRGDGKPGAARKDRCPRDHDMKVHGREIPKERGGGRYCSECKRMRERVDYKREKAGDRG